MKNVTFLVGVPCSGKSTYRELKHKNDFCISRDDLREQLMVEYNLNYDDLFKKPSENDTTHEKYGNITEDGNWSVIKEVNHVLLNRFNSTVQEAIDTVKKGGNVVVDVLNLAKKEREKLKEQFSDIDGVRFNAVIFEFDKNLPLIKKLNVKRGEETGKVIPEFLYEVFTKQYEKPNTKEFHTVIQVDGLKSLKSKQSLKNK